MGKYQSNSKYLCSVYPGVLPEIVRNYGTNPDAKQGRRSVFRFKPVDRFAKKQAERYDVMEIIDSWENIPNPSKPVQNKGRMPFDSGPVPCDEIVRDIMNVWCGSILGLPTGVVPGIMEIANSVPTEAEKIELDRRQAAFAQYMLQEGDRLNTEKRMKEITNAMRESARWLQQHRDWADPSAAADKVPCPACTQLVSNVQAVCHHCRTQIKALPAEIAALNQQAKQPVLAVQ